MEEFNAEYAEFEIDKRSILLREKQPDSPTILVGEHKAGCFVYHFFVSPCSL